MSPEEMQKAMDAIVSYGKNKYNVCFTDAQLEECYQACILADAIARAFGVDPLAYMARIKSEQYQAIMDARKRVDSP